MFRTLRYKCVFTTILFATEARAANTDRIGIYHWGGQLTTSMSSGVERIASLGGHVARVAYSPTYYTDYGVRTGCYPNYSLSNLAQEPDVQRALDNPDIHVFILTAYDGLTFGDCRHHKYFNPDFYTAENIAALKAEYSDFVLYLFRRYANTNRRFILSNWEGDNAVYCGAAWGYAVDPATRTDCDQTYPDKYEGNATPAQSFAGMRLWLLTRQAGIDDGLARARVLGLTGFEVLHAPELNIVTTLEQYGLPSLLRDVLPSLQPSYVSYSSYESLGTNDPASSLAADIATIRAITGVRGLIIGEAGYPRSDTQQVGHISVALQVSLQCAVDYFIYWNLNDQSSTASFGLFDFTGDFTATGRLFERAFRGDLSGIESLP